jgi:uncharacterized membrane protein
VVLVDLSDVDVVFKIITFIALGILLVGVSFVYNRFTMTQDNRELEKKG